MAEWIICSCGNNFNAEIIKKCPRCLTPESEIARPTEDQKAEIESRRLIEIDQSVLEAAQIDVHARMLFFSESTESRIKASLLTNPNLSVGLATRLLRDPDEDVVRAAEAFLLEEHDPMLVSTKGRTMQQANANQVGNILLVTTDSIPGYEVTAVLGTAAAAWSSHMRQESGSRQSTNHQGKRLLVAIDECSFQLRKQVQSMRGHAIVGLIASVNSSEGASALGGGSSDAMVLMGTVVRIAKLVMKSCEFCARSVLAAAKKCENCGEYFSILGETAEIHESVLKH